MTMARCIESAIELAMADDRAQPREHPCRALGMAVLHRAWMDALDQINARNLTGSTSRGWWSTRSRGLREWCAALDLDISWVVARARRRLAEYDAGDTETRRRIRGQCEYADRGEEGYVSRHEVRDPQDHRDSSRLYYVTHREDILAKRSRRRAARKARADRMEQIAPGYASRHPRNTQPSQAPDDTTENS